MLYNEYAIKLMTEQGFNPAHMYCIANSMDSDKEKEFTYIIKNQVRFYQKYFSQQLSHSHLLWSHSEVEKIRPDY